jgi:hypothetical protein
MEPSVFRLVDDTHAATKLLDYLVVRNGLPDERVSVGHSLDILGRVPEARQRRPADAI